MDKSWMEADRRSLEYEEGVEMFLRFAATNASDPNFLWCPCSKCGNTKRKTAKTIREHLYFNGVAQSYKNWIWHGQAPLSSCPSGSTNVEERPKNDFVSETVDMCEAARDEFDDDLEEFYKFVEDADQELYEGCHKHTKLSTLVGLYNKKAKYGWSDISFSELLVFIGDILPTGNVLPSSLYEAKKTLSSLGMEYKKIHACPNDCILYRNEYVDATNCPKCGFSRWKVTKDSREKKGVPAKVLWYFPPIPRFKRMFKSREVSKDLTWHVDERENDGMMRHPADSPAWRLVDHKWPDFASDPRNLRLALSADGINPHSNLSSRYSCWPVILVTYNLPPWLCMKSKFMILTLLISGPKQPGNKIDVYLAPLIDDLKALWEGVDGVYDAYREDVFTLKAVLLWTINDFPAYGNLSGCTVKGYKACPICGDQTDAIRLSHGKKMSYGGHRKFLPRYHPYRRQRKEFNNKQEFGIAPTPLSGEEVFAKVEGMNYDFGKKQKNAGCAPCMKKNKGELVISGSHDVLTMALNTPEHAGRVRGVGGNVNPSTYFHLPRQRRQSISKAMYLEHQKLFEETKKMFEEEREKERAYFLKKITELEARVNRNIPITPSPPISDKASCPSETMFNGDDAVKVFQSDKNIEMGEVLEIEVPKKPSNLKNKSCKLAVGSISNIVALGTIIEDNDSSKTIHGIPMQEGYSRVAVDVSIDAKALLPVPVSGELETVGQAIGSYVAWPKNLIVLNLEKIKKKKHVAPVKDLSIKNDGVKMVPSKCKALYHIAKNLMDNNSKALMSTLENEVFGVPRDLHIFKDDIIQLMEMQWLGANCIVAYMRYLYEILIKSDLVDTFGFMDPARVVSFGVSESKNVEKNLVERMQQGKSDRIFLVPYNPRNHWMLTIINEEKDIVYIADSLEEQEYPEWKETVNNAIKLFNGVTGRHGKKAPQWIRLSSAPKQVGGVECGYYVMRYMKEIIEDPTISFAQKWSKKSKRTSYSQEQIDEVRNEWSEFVTRSYL